MNRTERNALAVKIREVLCVLECAENRALEAGKRDWEEWKKKYPNSPDSTYPYAFGSLSAMIKHSAAQLEAIVAAHLDRKGP